MKDNKSSNKLSIFISLILRHKPEVVGLTLDERGYIEVSKLIEGINNKSSYSITLNELYSIVDTDTKKRYSITEDGKFIRANQGHSIPVNLNMESVNPPDVLYHGTSKGVVESIKKQGINRMSRMYVHLSDDIKTATAVGKRHGEPVILAINTQKMVKDNYKFYLSDNKVWLTDYVPVEYILFDNYDK